MPRRDVSITTPDGNCAASVITPTAEQGPCPGVLFCMDGLGIRPTMWDMGQRLADAGYLVLLPDLFYRLAPHPALDPTQVLANPAMREELVARVRSLDRASKVMDTAVFLDFLSTHPEVKGAKFGCTGYCMGGNFALTAAGAFPDKFAAVASFHGGSLATDVPDSPHHFLAGIKARIYVGGADHDTSFPPEQKERLERTLTAAGASHRVETYIGARHGFAVPDHTVFDAAAAERHWQVLLDLFAETLKA